MSARDELARIIGWSLGNVAGIYDTTDDEDLGIADTILSAGFQKTAPSAHGTTHVVRVHCAYCDGVEYQKVKLGESIKHLCPTVEQMTVTICAWEYESTL